jgi:hypothetical protein
VWLRPPPAWCRGHTVQAQQQAAKAGDIRVGLGGYRARGGGARGGGATLYREVVRVDRPLLWRIMIVGID